MKKFLIILIGVILIGCVPYDQDNPNHQIAEQYTVVYCLDGNSFGEELSIVKIDMKIDGHDMWIFRTSGEIRNIMHSPDCEKCNSKEGTDEITSILEEPSRSPDYWGW